ncbi:MAG TPA: glycosyltransferase [Verrucomicrobiae bacterium]|nr:glycosyltransferase [Verrucomicrobiae bacterium]
MTELSVIICSHNPRPEYLQRTLAALQAQTLPPDQWELLLVDNASQPPVAQHHDLSWHPQGRHVLEPVLGLTPARFRGVVEARGNWLVFVDDDNVLAPDYLAKVIELAASHPRLAVFGSGMLQPEFETPPPAELKSLLSMLALRDIEAPRWSNDPTNSAALPCGAGLCVRRETAGQCAALVEQLKACVTLDRKGGELFSHGDDLFSWAAARAGMEFGVFPELRITHLIGAGRLSQAYFLRLIYYHAFSHGIVRYLLAGETPRRAGFIRRLRLIPHVLRRGVFSGRCQWGWLKGEDRAARLISANNLRPLFGQVPKSKS